MNDRELLERYLDAQQRHMEDIGRYIKMGRGRGLDALAPITPEVVKRWKDLELLEREALDAWHEALEGSAANDRACPSSS
jgi:hypothetical protein